MDSIQQIILVNEKEIGLLELIENEHQIKLESLIDMGSDLLKVMNFIDRNGITTYIVTIVSAIIFNMLGFAIINTIISNVFKVLNFNLSDIYFIWNNWVMHWGIWG